jgi:hypothetical protein
LQHIHISDADAHATKTNDGNFEAASAEYALFHARAAEPDQNVLRISSEVFIAGASVRLGWPS